MSGQQSQNFPTEVAVAIAEIRTQMISVNNHIRESKDNYKNLVDKIDDWKDSRIDKDNEVSERISELETKCNEKETRINWKLGILFGIWTALEAFMKAKG